MGMIVTRWLMSPKIFTAWLFTENIYPVLKKIKFLHLLRTAKRPVG